MIVNSHFGFAQTPTYKLFATNFAQTASNIIEFDLYILRTGATNLVLVGAQIGLQLDSSITRINSSSAPYHSFIEASFIPGTSMLNALQDPTNGNGNMTISTVKSNGWADNHVLRLAPLNVSPPTLGSTISNINNGCSSPGTRIARIRLTSQTSLVIPTPVAYKSNSLSNGVFTIAGSVYPVLISAANITGTNAINITDPAQHFSYNVAGTCYNNLTLNPTPVTPVIASISPTTINAGVGEWLTINGSGFGNYRGSIGNVFFQNADTTITNTTAFFGLDAIDHQTTIWSNTQIKIRIPSQSIDPNTNKLFTPGGGIIKIRNFNNLLSSDTTKRVNINNAVKQFVYVSANEKKRQCLARYKCNNGLVYYLGNNIAIGSNMQKVIDSAFTAWSNYLNIDVKFAKNSSGTILQALPQYFNNDTNVIFLKSFGGDTLMSTSVRDYPTCIPDSLTYISDTDIGIKSTGVNWHFGVKDSLPFNTTDFYAAILHEIGHSLGLLHVNDIGPNGKLELMYWDQSLGQSPNTPVTGRKSLTTAGGNSAAGALADIINLSRTLNPGGCTNLNPLTTREISSPYITPPAPVVVCTGGSTTLSSSAALSNANGNLISNLWSTGDTTQVITVGGNTATYTVTVTQNNTCPVSASRVVTAAGTSTISTQPTNTTTCAGGTAIFSCASTGATFQWQRNINNSGWSPLTNGVYYTGVTSTTLNVLQANSYGGVSQQYRCLVTQPGFCATPTNTASLTVTTLSFSPGLASVYTGSSAFTLTGGAPSGGSYSGTGVSGSLFTPPSTAGSYNITYTKAGCSPVSATQNIQVVACGGTFPNCIKAITTNQVPLNFCVDGSPIAFNIVFTALGCPYILGNIFTAQLSNATGSFTSPINIGSINVTGGSFTNCTGTINATLPTGLPVGTGYRIRVVSSQPPIVGSINLDAISIDNSPCNSNLFIEVGRKAITETDIKIYPNPTSSEFTIELPFEDVYFHVAIYDLNGKEVLNQDIKQKATAISTLELIEGIYLIKLSNNNLMFNKKLLIIK